MTYATVQNAVALMLILTELTDNVTSAASIFVECIFAEYLFLFRYIYQSLSSHLHGMYTQRGGRGGQTYRSLY